MDAARRDFQDWWASEKVKGLYRLGTPFERVLCETVAWRAFVAAKGLAECNGQKGNKI